MARLSPQSSSVSSAASSPAGVGAAESVADKMDYSVPVGVRLLEAVHEESETSSMSSASIRSISLNTPDEDSPDGQAPTPPPKSASPSIALKQENEAPPLVQVGERKASWRDWLGFRGAAEDVETEELADVNAPPSPAISDTPSTPGGAGPFPYAFLQDPEPSTTSSMLVHTGDQSSTASTRRSVKKKKQYLLTVLPAKELSTDSPRLKKWALSRRGSLVPLFPSYRSQLEAIAHEYRLPSTDDIAIYLLSTTDAVRSQIPTEDGPRIGEAAWKVLWSDLFAEDDDDRFTRDDSFSSSDAYLSPVPPTTPSQSSGLFGSYSFFSGSVSSPQPPPQAVAPKLARSKSTPTTSPHLSKAVTRRFSGDEQEAGQFGAAVVVGRVEFDLEPASQVDDEEGRFDGQLSALTAFERRRSSGTSAASMAERERERERELSGFPSFERRRSSGTSSEGGYSRRPSTVKGEWAKRRGSTKPTSALAISSMERDVPPLPLVSPHPTETAPMIPSPPRWSPALSRGLFTPVEPPADQFPSPTLASLNFNTTQPLNISRSQAPGGYLSPPSNQLASQFSSAGFSPVPSTPSAASPPPSAGTAERRPSLSVGLASFLGNVKAEDHVMESVAETEEENEEIGLGVFGVPRDQASTSVLDRPDSTASSVPELVDTLEALQEALGFDSMDGGRRPSVGTTGTGKSAASGSEYGSARGSRRGSVQSSGHNRSQSSPVIEMANPFAAPVSDLGGLRKPAKRLPRSSELADESNNVRWSTVSPRNSAYLPTPSRAAPAPPMPAPPRVASPPTVPASTSSSSSKTSPPIASPLSSRPAGRFSLDSARPKIPDSSASTSSAVVEETKPASNSSMWAALPKLGGLFGSKASTVEFTEVLAAASPSASTTADSPTMSSSTESDIPIPGKPTRARTKSLSKKFASFRSALPNPNSTGEVSTVSSVPRQRGHSTASSTSSLVSATSQGSLILSPHAVSAVTNSVPPTRNGTDSKHRAAASLDSSIGGVKPRFEVELRGAEGKGEKRRVELPKDVLRAMI